jgi:hypothetical protein
MARADQRGVAIIEWNPMHREKRTRQNLTSIAQMWVLRFGK